MRELYKRYESGASLRNLQDWLEENQIKTVLGESKWTTTSIKGILTNEKYCGDVLLQKNIPDRCHQQEGYQKRWSDGAILYA